MISAVDELKIFTGNGHRGLAEAVCQYLDMPLGKAEVFKFANDNTFVRIQENVRQRDVFIIQPTCHPVNDNLMELLIMIDACKRASAGRITAVVPYYGYGRTDKKDQPRVPITARLVADLLSAARCRPHADRRSSCWPDPGLFQHPGGRIDRTPHTDRLF